LTTRVEVQEDARSTCDPEEEVQAYPLASTQSTSTSGDDPVVIVTRPISTPAIANNNQSINQSMVFV
jgi:hypothetical protein